MVVIIPADLHTYGKLVFDKMGVADIGAQGGPAVDKTISNRNTEFPIHVPFTVAFFLTQAQQACHAESR
jgi:hypothetical protein